MIDGRNKSLDEQLIILEEILRNNDKLMKLLEVLESYSLENPSFSNWYVGAGGVNQTVFNYYHGFDIDYGIKDYDIVYFDTDTSYEAEDVIIKDLEKRLKSLNIVCDIKNQARVHIWYNPKYGTNREAYVSSEDAISSWGSTVTCIACRLEFGKFKFYCPYGLDDLFNLVIRPVKRYFQEEQYKERSLRWKNKWNKLTIMEWSDWMKVLLVNGSPHKNGCTNEALLEIKRTLEENGVEGEIFWIGTKPLSGCLGCSGCFQSKRCIIDDKVNEFLDKAEEVDGFIFGSPVHYAGATGAITSFMDRAFYGKPTIFRGKPAASITSCRRAGGTSTFDILNKYFAYSCMPIVTSNYWNGVFGATPEEVREDKEGMQTMRILANNMAWMLKCIEAGKNAGIEMPKTEKKVFTNFYK